MAAMGLLLQHKLLLYGIRTAIRVGCFRDHCRLITRRAVRECEFVQRRCVAVAQIPCVRNGARGLVVHGPLHGHSSLHQAR